MLTSPSLWSILFSLLIHALFLAPTIYIIIGCVESNYNSLFIWHPTCFTVGCFFLMTEGVLAVSGEALLAAKVTRPTRVIIHWVLHILGLALLVVGFVTVVINKENIGRPHFTTDHGILGLVGTLASVVIGCTAILTLLWKTPRLNSLISLSKMKTFHVVGGIIAMVLLVAGQATGVQKLWGVRDDRTKLTLSAYIIGTIFLLAKPIFTTQVKLGGIAT
ncbi:transmembrane reductase CYB561D2 [Athalia rosae]|uniref:transmembrane reductase CYB561D2 n=1 Tax=Athalia rosae TaxID=37344 RepID=UPI000625A81B|nr:transmembrane reductase CYB561D2 [Athalia rosae]